MQTQTINLRRGAFGQPSVPFLLSRRAHLLTTLKGRWYLPLASRALSEGDCGCCGSLQTMPQHLRAPLSSSVRLGKYRRFNRRYFPTACANLPPAALPQRWTGLLPVHFLFCERETEKRNHSIPTRSAKRRRT